MQEISERLESVAKALAIAGAVLYTTGLVVASLRLAQLGIVSTEFIKPLYILTGIWAWLPIVMAAAIWFVCRETLRLPHLTGPRRIAWAVAMMILLAAFEVLIIFVIPNWTNRFLHTVTFSSGFAPFMLVLVAFSLGTIYGVVAVVQTQPELNRAFSPLTASIPVLMSVCYVIAFTFGPYIRIPAQLGGAGPRLFKLVVDDPKIRRMVTGQAGDASPIITFVLAETMSSYVTPAPKAPVGEFILNSSMMSDLQLTPDLVFEDSFVIIPKSAVLAATVIGKIMRPAAAARSTESSSTKLDHPSPTPQR